MFIEVLDAYLCAEIPGLGELVYRVARDLVQYRVCGNSRIDWSDAPSVWIITIQQDGDTGEVFVFDRSRIVGECDPIDPNSIAQITELVRGLVSGELMPGTKRIRNDPRSHIH